MFKQSADDCILIFLDYTSDVTLGLMLLMSDGDLSVQVTTDGCFSDVLVDFRCLYMDMLNV